MPLASFKLATALKFFRYANLSWVNEESCFSARRTWPLMDRKCTHQLLELNRDIIPTTVAMLTGHCVMVRNAEIMQLPFNDFWRGCRSAKKGLLLLTVIHFFCHCPTLARCRNRLLGFPFLVSLTELSSADMKGWFSRF